MAFAMVSLKYFSCCLAALSSSFFVYIVRLSTFVQKSLTQVLF